MKHPSDTTFVRDLNFGRRASRWHTSFAIAFSLLAAASTLRALDPAKSIFQFNLQNWTRLSGLPADKITSITQTIDGYIWLGSQNGLIRFNGLDFTSVPIALHEAYGQEVGKLSATPDGGLLFSITQGGYGILNKHTFSTVGAGRWTSPGVSSNTVFRSRNGEIWSGSVYGWARWTSGKPEQSQEDHEFGSVLSFNEDSSGRIWMGTAEGGLFFWDEGKFVPFHADELKAHTIVAVEREAAGDLWVGTNRGLYHYDSKSQLKEILLGATKTTALLVDRRGALWIGTEQFGLGRYQDRAFTFLHKSDGLGSDSITSLFEDAEGSLWVGTVDGISQLSDLKFPIYSAKEGLVPGIAIAVAASQHGGLWISTSTGATYFDGRAATNYTDPALLPNNYIRRVFEAKNGDVYLCDGDKNINIINDGRLISRISNTYWPEAFVDDTDGIVAGIGPNLHRVRNGKLEPYPLIGEAPRFDWINGLAFTKEGALWVATNNGLFRIKDGHFRRWSTLEGLSSDRIHFVYEDTDGSIWLGLPTGLIRFKDDRITQITVENGLSDNRIYSMVADDRGFFWIASGHGVFRVSRQNLSSFVNGKSARIDCVSYDGLESVKFTDRTEQAFTACKTLDGRLWFPNPRGVMMVDPDRHFTNQIPPRVSIESILVNGTTAMTQAAAALQPGVRSLEISFAALSYIAPKKISVRYQLEGFDRTWIDAGSLRTVTYNNLGAGRYNFRVQASNADGVWNTTGDSFAVEIPTPFYNTYWFYGACGLSVAGSLFGAFRWKVQHMQAREHRLRAENDALEVRVNKRTDELANSLSLLQATLDSTADGILAIHFSGEIVSYNRRFREMWRIPAEFMQTAQDADIVNYTKHMVTDPEKFIERIQAIREGAEPEAFDIIEMTDGRFFERYCKPQQLEGKNVGIVVNFRDITKRRLAEANLAEVHQQLLGTSRQAGMAEVATSVLHNVGNVLNSVNVSATLVADRLQVSKTSFVAKISGMLQANSADLGAFLTVDPKGKKIPAYLATLSDELAAEQRTIIEELGHLRKNIEHIKEIVSMQQNFAKVSGVAETVALTELVEDALRINVSALARHEVEIVRDYQVQPIVTLERHKLMQVLVNLVRNAKYACDDARRPDKQMIVRITQHEGRFQIAVIDNGVGIPEENLTRIFSHGFTTRKEGHGFGLHSGALVAKELGGSLVAQSDGPGLGATFTIDLPLKSSAHTS